VGFPLDKRLREAQSKWEQLRRRITTLPGRFCSIFLEKAILSGGPFLFAVIFAVAPWDDREKFRVWQLSMTFKKSFIANGLSGFVHSGCRANQNSTPPRCDVSPIIEGNENHLYYLVDGVPILNAAAFVHMAAIEKNCGHDWR
jgi:hypothetical protein